MSVEIVERIFSKDRCLEIRERYADKLLPAPHRPAFFEMDADRSPEILAAVALARMNVEQHFDVIIDRHQAMLVRLEEGAFNGLHSDMYNLDGSDWDDETKRKDELEYSAILYLSEYGVDFTGGELVFPQHDLKVQPKIGDLVFFRGDLDHTHKVRHILSGERYAVVMFFGK